MNASRAPARSASRWLPPLAAAAGAALYAWMSWCAFTDVTWNEVRLAPAFALRHGWPLFPALGGGPLSTWIYGPLGAAANLPATFASSTVGALQLAGLINALTLTVPLAVIFFGAEELRRHGWPTRLLAFALGVLTLQFLSLVYQVPDHLAIALGLLSCWCLARHAAPSTADTALAAALGVAAIWTKQTAVFLVPALALFLLSLGAPRACARFLAWTVALGTATVALNAAIFGADNLWFNLVTIPGHLPWADLGEKISERLPQLLAFVALPWALLIWLRRGGRAPQIDSQSGRFLRCATFAALAVLPIGLAALCKIGGEIHLIHSGFYLFPALVLAWLARTPPTPVVALAVVGVALALHAPEFSTLPLQPRTQRVAIAEQLARANPGRLWFPQNPLVTFYADGQLYHVEDGLVTRHLAGFGVRERDFLRHLPPQLTAVVYPAATNDTFSLQLLPQFTAHTTVGPWVLHQRAPSP